MPSYSLCLQCQCAGDHTLSACVSACHCTCTAASAAQLLGLVSVQLAGKRPASCCLGLHCDHTCWHKLLHLYICFCAGLFIACDSLQVMAGVQFATPMSGQRRLCASAMSATMAHTKGAASSAAARASLMHTIAKSALCKRKMCATCSQTLPSWRPCQGCIAMSALCNVVATICWHGLCALNVAA